MFSSVPSRIRLILFASILAVAISIISLGIARSIHRTETADYQKRCGLYAVALASTSEAWLPSDDSELKIPLLSLGVVYLRVAVNEEIVIDVRRPAFSSAQLPPFTPFSLAGATVFRFEDLWAIDVAVPQMLVDLDDPEEDGILATLQFGIDASELIDTYRQTTRLISLLSLATWIVGSILLACLSRFARRRTWPEPSPPLKSPDASRCLLAGNLTLLFDDLMLAIGDVTIDLTPKQAGLLDLLIRAPGRAFSDTDILGRVWQDSAYANSSDVKQQIYLIRKRLRAVGLTASDILVTVPGVGYKLVVTTDDEAVDATSTDRHHR